jgi:hypothetical protein
MTWHYRITEKSASEDLDRGIGDFFKKKEAGGTPYSFM